MRSTGAMVQAARQKLMRLSPDEALFCDAASCAEFLSEAGFSRAARVLMDVAAVRAGFSAFGRRARAGGWAVATESRAAAPEAAGPMSRAARELAALMGAFPEPGRAVVERREAPPSAPATQPIDVDALAEGLRAALDADGGPATFKRLQGWLDIAEPAVLAGPSFEAAEHVGADVDALAEGVAGEWLRRFLARHRLAAYPPFGSAALLHRLARLDDAALGPYFGNLPGVARTGLDLMTLAQAAADEAGAAAGRAENWAALMASTLPADLLADAVEAFAEAGRLDAVWLVVAARGEAGEAATPMLEAARDIALDARDYALANLAQTRRVHASPQDAEAWRTLGDIEASRGRRDAAERAYERALALVPTDTEAALRLRALRQGAFERYRLQAGLETRAERRERRSLPAAPAWRDWRIPNGAG